MTAIETRNFTQKAYTALNNSQIQSALNEISTLVDTSSSGDLHDELERIKLEYSYLLKYFASGIKDPDRERIHNSLINRLYYIVDKAKSIILSKEDYSQYYSQKRIANKSTKTLNSILQQYYNILNDIKLYQEVNDDYRDKTKVESLINDKELIEMDLFKTIWVSFPQDEAEISIFTEIFESPLIPAYTKSLTISAIFLSLLNFYNDQLLALLLKNYSCEDDSISIQSLCVAIIILFIHKNRISNNTQITDIIKSHAENKQFANDVRSILFQLVRSKNTEKLTRKVEEELIPKIMKAYPKAMKKFKTDKTIIDISELESNPEWKEMMDNDGITKKIEELNKLQMEGGDVFISTFSHLKSFPFFSEISNWFIPFHKEHSLLNNIFNKKESGLINIILESRYFCDSDKYSFVASLTSVPETQRNMMLTQFDEQNTAIQELKNSELNTNSVDRSAIANSYIQNIYRFFKLYPRSSEFNNPFNNPFDVTDIQVINENVDLDDALPIIAEFYLKNEYYNEAIKYFEILNNSEHSRKTVYLQKIGFCYQNTERYNEAIEYYHKYELNSNNDLWNLRHLAACYRALRQPAMALKYYKSAEEISPENISICLNIGHCLLETEQYEEALKYYYKVYYLDPNNPRAWRPIAWCLFIQGNYSQSRIYYD